MWKQAILFPIRKPLKSPKRVESYGRITLINKMFEILEKLILKILNRELTDNIIIKHVFGENSKDLQLAQIIDTAKIAHNFNKITTIPLLNLERAYGTIWRDGLI